MEAVAEENLTALQRKWQQEEENLSSIENAFTEDGDIDVENLEKNIMAHLPTPTGWRIALLPYRGAKRSRGGIELAEETQKKTQLATTCGYVLRMGDLAYMDQSKFPNGPWCKEGDWVIFGRYAGSRIPIDGGEIRLLNDDEILGTVADPKDVLHMY